MKSHQFKNGDLMPSLGLGTWKSERGEIYKTIRKSIEIGYRHFDCAFIYQNEKEIGTAINDAILGGEINRDEIWITSKLWNNSHAKLDVKTALQSTLQDFGIEYLDLYLIHWPVATRKDVIFAQKGEDLISLNKIPLIDTWKGMETTVDEGLTKHIGVSNFSSTKIKLINQSARIKVEVNQVESHPLLQQNELLDFCNKEEIIMTSYSPLGSRDRGPEMKADNEPDLFEIPSIIEIANSHKCSPAQILIAWAICRGTAVIPKSTNEQRLLQNIYAAQINLSEGELNEISKLDKHYRYITGAFFALPGSDYTVSNLWDEQ